MQATRQVDALVLSVEPFGEQDRLLTLLAPTYGVVRGVARGARKHSSHLFAATSPLVLMRAAVRVDSAGFCDVREARPLEAFASGAVDPLRLAYLSAVSELVRAIARTEPVADDDGHLFTDTVAALRELATGERPRLAVAAMAAGQFPRLGIAPDWTQCAACGGVLATMQPLCCSLSDGPLCQTCAADDSAALTVPGAVHMAVVALTGPNRGKGDRGFPELTALSREDERTLYDLVVRLLSEWGGIVLKSLQIAERMEPARTLQAGIDPSS
ncbi:MAG: DNA repair protein RecO [Firmicutes bacterium]|nr:DNA repair protein RecO [Bacillota bacterium]